MINTYCKYSFIFILALISVNKLFAQDSAFRFERKIEYPIQSFTVNNLGEIYLINLDNQLKKIDQKGDSAGVFNQVTKYGKLTYIEAQNPWKTLLFYENFSTIVLLDKYLSVLTSINLRKQNIFRVKAISASYDNNIWLYDEQENKLKKIDDAGKVLSETVDFRLLFDSVPSPKSIVDRDGFVYVYDPEKGLYTFDYYGSFKSKIPLLHWNNVTVIGKNIYGFDKKYFYSYSIGGLNIKQRLLPPAFKDYTSLKLGVNKIYLLKNNNIEIYSLQ
jgi:hypothetical protein